MESIKLIGKEYNVRDDSLAKQMKKEERTHKRSPYQKLIEYITKM